MTQLLNTPLLLRAGVPVTSKLFNPQNAVYAQRHEPGSLPRAWGAPVAARGLIGWVLNAMDGHVGLPRLAMGGAGLLSALFLAGRHRKRRRGKRKRGHLAELVGLVGLLALLAGVAVAAFGLAAWG